MQRVLLVILPAILFSVFSFTSNTATARDRTIEQFLNSTFKSLLYVRGEHRIGFSFSVELPSRLTSIEFQLFRNFDFPLPPVELRLYEVDGNRLVEIDGSLKVVDELQTAREIRENLVEFDYESLNLVLRPGKTYAIAGTHDGDELSPAWLGIAGNRGNPYSGGSFFFGDADSDEVTFRADLDARFRINAEPAASGNGFITYCGTSEDDIVTFDPDQRQLTINGTVMDLPSEIVAVNFVGDEGDDVVICNDRTGESDLVVLEDRSIKMNMAELKFRATESEYIEFIGSDPDDIAIIFDTEEQEDFRGLIGESKLDSAHSTLIARNVDSVYMFSQGGDDTANYRGLSGLDTLFCNLDQKKVRAQSAGSLIVIEGFERFYSFAGEGNGNRAFIQDSAAQDFVYADPDVTRIFNSELDYLLESYDGISIRSDGISNDRAVLNLASDSEYRSGASFDQLLGTGYSNLLLDFNIVTVVDP